MTFVNLRFYPAILCLILIVALIQSCFKNRQLSNRLSKALLLIFSYISIGLFDWRFCLCVLAVTLIAFISAIKIEIAENDKRGGIMAAVSVIVLVAFLGVFKYLNFFMSSITAGFGHSWTTVNIILPIGISFYVFSAIGYILDVRWGVIPAEKNFLDMALYMSFFPKLVCGPIVNARDFLPQLKEDRKITWKNIEVGIQIFVFGMFKKFLLADRLALFVNDTFAAPAAYGTLTIWLAVLSYYLQLYFDFSGYSDMAIGISKLFGYDIKRNFNLPFIARNISDFWDRWHISLTTWLNEYVFNPIAMRFRRRVARLPKEKRARYKMLPTYGALMITFLVSGLWHGAGYTFIIWGLCHGVYSVIHSIYANWMKKHHRDFAEHKSKVVVALDILANYIVINVIQVIFRAETLGKAMSIYKRMFIWHAGVEQPYTWAFFAFVILAVATFAAYRRSRSLSLSSVEGYYPIMDLCTVKGLFFFFVMLGFTLLAGYFGSTYFIYAQF